MSPLSSFLFRAFLLYWSSLRSWLIRLFGLLLLSYPITLITMPKDRRACSVSEERRRCASPFSYRSSNYHKHIFSSSSSKNPIRALPTAEDTKKWEEIRCPICMEHPHNAVLLLCTSNEKGCHVYMCNTSHRHSNCLDLFRKSCPNQTSREGNDEHVEGSLQGNDEHDESNLQCPLCRGIVKGWTVVDDARRYMNDKTRICSLESCSYSGRYEDLRKHARMDHPFRRPAQADPERQLDWRRMEQQRDLGDLLSSMRSTLGMDETEIELGEIDDDLRGSVIPATSFARVSLYIFIQVLATGGPNVLQYFSRTSRGATGGRQRGSRSRLWGESYNDDTGSFGRNSSSNALPDEHVLEPELHYRRSWCRRMRLPDDESEL